MCFMALRTLEDMDALWVGEIFLLGGVEQERIRICVCQPCY
jgi:hypothetical protein